MIENMSIQECAEILGVTQTHLRMGIQQGEYPFGVAVRSKGGKKCRYKVFKKRFEKWLEGEGIF